MKLLLTGATGYTGRGMAPVLATRHDVRGLDIQRGETVLPDLLLGDLTDLETCRQAVDGRDAIVMCHMAPNPDGYKTPPPAIDINVKGTANLYHAAMEAGIDRVILISTTGVLRDGRNNTIPGEGPYQHQCRFYALTKIMQEYLARYYYEIHQISTVALRPGWIVYDESLTTKYGERMTEYNASLIDPRDIATAVIKALDLPDPGIVAFTIAQDDSKCDQANTHAVLDWRPQYTFAALARK